ncbi:rlmB [Symbiodinium natans]|uniref:RlmB protein n=1 Tax=Symbiodinium natans TaxID=878477 RepID=A0A812V6V5_9DINO|nr:rlmB [Symbiodinium natans]
MAHDEEELPEDDSVGIALGPAPAPAVDGEGDAAYCYLILFNLNKRNNLGACLRSAAAFGVRLVMLVGRQGFKAFCKKSGQGAVPIEHAATIAQAVEALKARHPSGRLSVCGVEILEQAQSLHQCPFRGPTAFMLGNERGGLTRDQIAHCDSFVYIPQFGGGVGSLNVACACSVVLYQYSAWASQGHGLGFPEDARPSMPAPHGAGSFVLRGSRPMPPALAGSAVGESGPASAAPAESQPDEAMTPTSKRSKSD